MILTSIFELSNDFAYLIFETAWKSTIILGSVVLLNKFLKRQSASLRQSIFSTAIITLLALMFIAPVFPRWNIFLPTWLSINSFVKSVNETHAEESANLGSRVTEVNSGIKTDSILDSQPQPDFENQVAKINFVAIAESVIFFIWLAVTFILLRRLWKSLFGLKYLRRTSGIQVNTDLNSLVQDISKKFGCGQNITVLKNEAVTMPITWGIIRHIILLPKDFDELPVEYRRAILTHELNHIERYDFVIRALTEIVCAILWFQPLIWSVRRQLREEQERVADDRVLAMGEKPSNYAKLLLEWNERLTNGDHLPVAAGMIERSGLKLRINAILNPNLKRRSTARLEILLIWLATLSLAIPLTGLGFSREILSDEKISVGSVNQTESLFQVSDENSPNNNAITSRNKGLDERAEKTANRKLPTKIASAVISRSEESSVKSDVKVKNETKENKNVDGESATISNQILPPNSVIHSSTATKAPLVEKREIKPSPAVTESPPGNAGKMVKQVFENIRQGFKNGKKPINIFEP